MLGILAVLLLASAALFPIGLLLLILKKTRRLGCWLAGLSCLCAIGIYFYTDSIDRSGNRQFDQQVWTAEADTGGRVHMVDSLIAKHRLDGMDRKRLIGLIGEPTQTGYFRDWDMVYWLGPERARGLFGFSIDSEWLVFDIDPAGKVAKYEVVRD